MSGSSAQKNSTGFFTKMWCLQSFSHFKSLNVSNFYVNYYIGCKNTTPFYFSLTDILLKILFVGIMIKK